MRYTITTLLLLIVYCSLAFASITRYSLLWVDLLPVLRTTAFATAIVVALNSSGRLRSVLATFATFGILFSTINACPDFLFNLIAETIGMPENGMMDNGTSWYLQRILSDHFAITIGLVASVVTSVVCRRNENRNSTVAGDSKSKTSG